jgi:hypothetical protein
MPPRDFLFEYIGIKTLVIVSGFLGALIQLSQNPKLSFWGALLSIIAGVSCAAFVTPMLHYYWTIPTQLEYGLSFFMGLLGMQLTGKVYHWFETASILDIFKPWKK